MFVVPGTSVSRVAAVREPAELIEPSPRMAVSDIAALSGAVGPLQAPVAAVGRNVAYRWSGADLIAVATPLTATTPSADGTVRYRVGKGETISGIAARFGITTDTIRWANPSLGRDIRPGTELIILPVSGILYSILPGDSLVSVAARYGVDPTAIRTYNPRYQEIFADGSGSLILAAAKPIVAVKIKGKK